MAWTTPRTWVAGEVVTAALLNAHVRDNLLAVSGLWTGYTPTISGFAGTLTVARYTQIGKTVSVYVKYTVTSVSGTMSVSLPATASTNMAAGTGAPSIGRAIVIDNPAVNIYFGDVYPASTTTVQFFAPAGPLFAAAVPITWTSGDTISFSATYEAA
jgi:hypothetical protein